MTREEPALCPRCGKKLEWKQLNFNEAVEICIDLKCPFPAGAKCRVRSRPLKDIQKVPEPSSNIDELLDQQLQNLENVPLGDMDDFISELDDFLLEVHDKI